MQVILKTTATHAEINIVRQCPHSDIFPTN